VQTWEAHNEHECAMSAEWRLGTRVHCDPHDKGCESFPGVSPYCHRHTSSTHLRIEGVAQRATADNGIKG